MSKAYFLFDDVIICLTEIRMAFVDGKEITIFWKTLDEMEPSRDFGFDTADLAQAHYTKLVAALTEL